MITIPWFKVDDGFHGHPKVIDLTLEAIGLWTLAGSWCAQYLTDGAISTGQIRRLGGSEDHAQELVDAGLWVTERSGYHFKDWDDYQPIKSDVEAEREAARERMREVRAKRKGTKKKRSEDVRPNNDDVHPEHPQCSPEVRLAPTQSLSQSRPDQEVPNGTSTREPDADESSQLALIPPEPPPASPTELFTQFWDAYPRKDDKGKAQEKFKAALNRAPVDRIIAGAERYRDDPNRDPSFTKLPTTWLNADAWDNGPLPPRQGARQSSADQRLQKSLEIIGRRMPPPDQRGEINP